MKPKDTVLDLLWHPAHFTQINDEQGRPGWSGYMSKVCEREYPGKSLILMLPNH